MQMINGGNCMNRVHPTLDPSPEGRESVCITHHPPPAAFKVSRAMTSFWTSLAPS